MSQESSASEIVCRSTKWYLWRRALPLAILPLAMSAWFFYDYKVGYPRKMADYQEYTEFQRIGGDEQEWLKKGKSKKPDEITQEKIDGQLHWSIGAGVLGICALVYYSLSVPKTLTADAVSFTTPWGRRIPFESIHRLDKRKWRHKGLAYAFFKDASGSGKAVLDDLRFSGAQQILDRIEAAFHGEVIDLEVTGEAPGAEAENSEA